MMDLFIVISYNCQRNMSKIWAGMLEQLFDLVPGPISDLLGKRELILSLAYASSNISLLCPNKSDTGQQLTK